jgi:bifunctional non-homologous end joining protein LigD
MPSLPEPFEPMKATLAEKAFSDPDWIFERKLDGIRALVLHHDGEVSLYSRTRKRLVVYPEIEEALAERGGPPYVADGEIVAFEGGRTSFSRLQGRMQLASADAARRTGIPVYLYLFDLVFFDGHDLRELPVRKRKSALRRAFHFEDPIRYLAHRNERGEELYREACEKGLEGIIAKRADSPYVHKRSRDWLKLKCSYEQELVIGGFTAPKGARTEFGALLVGYWEDGRLRYAGKVGTGFDQATLRSLGAAMREIERDDPPFADIRPVPRDARWTEPRLVAQVAFGEWTRDGRLRHPRFLGLRDDKPADDVVRERPS